MRAAPTHKFPAETIDRVMNEGGQKDRRTIFLLGCSFIMSVHGSESILEQRSEAAS